jgi:hypothetical protein
MKYTHKKKHGGYLKKHPTKSSKKSSTRRVHKGGMWGHVIKQAIAPLSILAMQQKYKPRKNRTGKFRKASSKRRTARKR